MRLNRREVCFMVFAPNPSPPAFAATEPKVRKKIRAVQYGVGPIGAAILRLMREKQALEIIGAIDTDPAKAGRDLGELVGADDAPWGVIVSAESAKVLA